jgi:hypothetical protein
MAILVFIAILAFGIAQFYVGFIGIEHYWGSYWAAGLILASLMFRTTLVVTVAAFFGARDVLHWHWGWALLFAAPGLLFILPAMVTAFFSRFSRS